MATDIDEMKRRGWLRTVLFVPILCLMLFAPAGTLRFWPGWLFAGNGGVVASFAIFFVILQQNSYAASTVTVEPGQPVVSTGLYGTVRHPMYAGALLLMAATPLALDSYWGLLVGLGGLPILIWRLLDEERILTRDLPGYADYCTRVHYRLAPFIW